MDTDGGIDPSASDEIGARRFSRRTFIKGSAAAGVLLGGAGSLLPLGGAGASTRPRAGGRTLQFLAWDVEPAQIKANIAAFERQSGDKVSVGIIPGSSYASALQTRMQGGAQIDAYYNYMVDSGRFAAAGWAAKLNNFRGAEQMVADMFPKSRSRYVLPSGEIISAPYFTAVHLLHYNQAFLKKHGISAPPTSLQQIYSQSKKLKSAGIATPYDAFWRKDFLEQYLMVYLLGQGITPFDNKDNPVFADHASGAEEVFAWWQTMYQENLTPKDILTPDPNTVAVRMGHGTTAFLELHHYYLQIIRSGGGPQAKNVQLSYRPPGVAGAPTLQVGEVLQMGTKSGSSAKQAWELLKFYGWQDTHGQYTTFISWAKSLALLAPYPAMYKQKAWIAAFPSYYNIPALEQVHRNAEVVPTRVRSWYPAFATSAGNRISSLVLGQATPKATLAGLVSDAKAAKSGAQ